MAFVMKQGLLPLTGDLWMKIMLDNEQLSLRDVEALCEVNNDFRVLCKEREIWRRLFAKQVPDRDKGTITGGYRMVSNETAPLDYKRLVYLWRIYIHPKEINEIANGKKETWHFEKRVFEQNLVSKFTIDYAYYSIVNVNLSQHIGGNVTTQTLSSKVELENDDAGLNVAGRIIAFLNRKKVGFSRGFTTPRVKVFGVAIPSAMELPKKMLVQVFEMLLQAGYTFEGEREAGINAQICMRIGCAAPGKKKCALCDKIYCSDDCGKLDWPTHDLTHF